MKKYFFLFLMINIFHILAQEPARKKRKISFFIKEPTKITYKRKPIQKLPEPVSKKAKRENPLIQLEGKVQIIGDPHLLAPEETIKALKFLDQATPCIKVSAMNTNATYFTPNDWNSQGHPSLAWDKHDLGIHAFPHYLPLSWFENKNEGDKVKFFLFLPNGQGRLITLTCAYFEFWNSLSTEPNTLSGYVKQFSDQIKNQKANQANLLKEAKKRAQKKERRKKRKLQKKASKQKVRPRKKQKIGENKNKKQQIDDDKLVAQRLQAQDLSNLFWFE